MARMCRVATTARGRVPLAAVSRRADPDGKDSVKTPDGAAEGPGDQVAAIRRGECPACGATLTDPLRSAGGWRHCRICRRAWAVETVDGQPRPTWQVWPDSASPGQVDPAPWSG